MSTLRHWIWLSTRGPAPGMYAARLLEAFGSPEGAYHADSRQAAERCMKFQFTNITANDPHELIAYLDEIGRRVGK